MERKEAIEIVKKYLPNNGFTISREALETLIPELQESEDEDDDDGIRKDLIEFVQQYGDNYYGQFSKASAISWLEKQGKKQHTNLKEDNTNEETNAPTEYGKYVEECLNEASKHFFSEGEDKYSVADLFYAGVRCGKSWLEKQGGIDLEHYEDSENEKRKFVGYGFLKCKGDFLSFKEGKTYWLEYVGKDNYNVRSDNLLGQTFHIKPVELYTVFRPTTWLEKQGVNSSMPPKEIAKSISKSITLSLINYLDNNRYEGSMNMSSMECEDLENAILDLDWGKVYRYMRKKLEKQGEQNGINLIETLKHCPRETELYSPLYGKLWLAEVDEENEIITCYKHCLDEGCTRAILEQEDTVSFYSDGTTGLPDFNVSKDCMLFLYDITKQGEQKSANTIESKFKVGDWIAGEGVYTAKIINIDNDKYEVEFIDGSKGLYLIDFIYKFYHPWTINDAKDGDVVVDKSDGAIGIFQSIGHHPDGGSYNDPSYCFLHCRYDDGFLYADFENGNMIDSDDLIPATKEQRDLLFSKMDKAGYEWDVENKVLRKQGKQETTNKVEPKFEPKFKVGDWIVANDGINTNNGTNTFLITNINCNHCSSGDVGIISIYCALEDTEGVTHYPCLLSENFFHRWTIEDVRDGDILVDEDNNIGIYKEKDDLNLNWGSHIYLGCDNRLRGFSIGGYHKIKNTKPATKEQRKLLFQNLGQVGYEWDSDEKRLKNIMEW